MPHARTLRRAVGALGSMLALGASAWAAAEPIAQPVEVSAEVREAPQCGMAVLLAEAPVPTAAEVGIPAFPGAVVTGRTGAGTGTDPDGGSYVVLDSVFLLTTASVEEVVDFYAEHLDDSWSHGTLFGSPLFYQHEEVDELADLLFDRPGALPVVEIVEVWSDCDRMLLSGARTAIRLYFPPN